MEFSDESYVRLYVRDTKTWLRLGFEGQCVLMFMLRKLDRAGVLDGIDDPAEDISLLTGVPLDVVMIGLPRLLERGVFVLAGSSITMPNYLTAQHCRKSDRLRQHESRVRRSLGDVTNRDEMSPPVTGGHQPSQPVTPSLAQLSLAKPSSESMSDPAPPAPDALAVVRRVFATWQTVHGHPAAKLDAKRTARIRRALKLHTPEQLEQAIHGALKDDWLMGRDPKSPRKYDGLETLLRDAAQVERLIDLDTGKATANAPRLTGSKQRDHGVDPMKFFKGVR